MGTRNPRLPRRAETNDRHRYVELQVLLNPDVFSGQEPQTDAEKEEMAKDEQDVRDACASLRDVVIPGFLNDLRESDISFPMDGRSLSRILHRRGINLRATSDRSHPRARRPRLQCLHDLCVREMIARSFKHVAAKYLALPAPALTSSCIAHLLNCLLGSALNPKPTADVDESLRSLYDDADLAFEKVTPETLRRDSREGGHPPLQVHAGGWMVE